MTISRGQRTTPSGSLYPASPATTSTIASVTHARVVRTDDKRRHYVDKILERPDPDTAPDELVQHDLHVHRFFEFDDADRTQHANVDDLFEVAAGFESGGQLLLDSGDGGSPVRRQE